MLEIVGSAFLFDPRDALFGPEGPSRISVAKPVQSVDSAHVVVVMANDRCHGSRRWAQSSWFSSSALCLRVKNPS